MGVVLNLTWLRMYSTNWWSNEGDEDIVFSRTLGIKRFVVIMSYFVFFMNVAVLPFLFKIRRDLPLGQSRQAQPQHDRFIDVSPGGFRDDYYNQQFSPI